MDINLLLFIKLLINYKGIVSPSWSFYIWKYKPAAAGTQELNRFFLQLAQYINRISERTSFSDWMDTDQRIMFMRSYQVSPTLEKSPMGSIRLPIDRYESNHQPWSIWNLKYLDGRNITVSKKKVFNSTGQTIRRRTEVYQVVRNWASQKTETDPFNWGSKRFLELMWISTRLITRRWWLCDILLVPSVLSEMDSLLVSPTRTILRNIHPNTGRHEWR